MNKPPLLRQRSVFLELLDEVDESLEIYMPESNDMIEYDCPSCYTSFNTDVELSEHVILTNCFLEKMRKEKDSHRLEIELLKTEHKTTIISYLSRIQYLENQIEWFTTIFQKIEEYAKDL